MLQEGDQAPDFRVQDQDGNERTLQDYSDKYLLLYFYPRDNTPGCTKEACTFRDRHSELEDAGVQIVGVSSDSPKSHTGFIAKHELPFSLLADTESQMKEAYGVRTIFAKRVSFLINPQGKIVKIYKTVKPLEHPEQVLEDMRAL